jgi:hypothetical protein
MLQYNIADHSFTRKRFPYRVGLQESTCMETCLSTRSLTMGLHVTIYSDHPVHYICDDIPRVGSLLHPVLEIL